MLLFRNNHQIISVCYNVRLHSNRFVETKVEVSLTTESVQIYQVQFLCSSQKYNEELARIQIVKKRERLNDLLFSQNVDVHEMLLIQKQRVTNQLSGKQIKV